MIRLSSIARRIRPSRVAPMAFGFAVIVGTAPFVLGSAATGQSATPPPNTFSMRLEGFAVEANTFSTATAVTPRSAYSFAKLNSVLDLDGGRGLDMEARGANDQYAGLEGAVLFSGDVPTNGNNLPGYAQAFFPTFEGFSTVSEKCAANQTEARETPECRDQPGPYALARVTPDEAAPTVEGVGRNEGEGAGGDARSRSAVGSGSDGTVEGTQSNSGTDQGVPGTPITVDSYVAEQHVVATIGSATTEIRCEGQVSVAGQPVQDDKQLQRALAPLTVGSNLRVSYEPPTEPVIRDLSGGALQGSCRGPRFTVFSGGQGGTGTTYTFGSTFAAVGITENADFSFDSGGGVDGGFVPPVGGVDPSFPSAPAVTDDVAGGEITDTEPPADEDAAAPSTGGEQAGPDLIRRSIDTVPIALMTGLATVLLPLGVWLLLGVTGSLARGLPALRLPPFD